MKLTAESTVFNDDKVQSKFAELVVDADGIRTEVGKKVGNDEVISRINQSAESIQIQASKVAIEADNFVTQFGTDGVKLHPKNDDLNYTTIDPTNGMNVYKEGVSVAEYGDTARIGPSGKGRVDIAPSGIDMYGYNANASPTTQNLCHIGFANGNAVSGQAIAPYFTFGTRASGSSIGNYSVAEGYNTTASHWASHAEGGGTKASSNYTHAEGSNTTASAMYAHAEGFETTASDVYAHAEGYGTKATNDAAHAEGYETQANGYGSHAQNVGTVASGTAQTVIGKYNVADTTSLFIIGNGANEGSRKNAAVVTDTGDLYLKGNLYVSSNDAGTSGTKANSGIDIASKITFGSDWTQQVRVARRIGNMVFFQLEANAGSFNANTNYVLANIASGYRPAVQQFATGITTDSSYNPKGTVSAVLKTDGTVNIRTQAASSSGAYVFVSGFYYTS